MAGAVAILTSVLASSSIVISPCWGDVGFFVLGLMLLIVGFIGSRFGMFVVLAVLGTIGVVLMAIGVGGALSSSCGGLSL